MNRAITGILAALMCSVFLNVKVQAQGFPVEYWAIGDVLSNVDVSPDGKKLSLMKRPSKKSDPIIEIFDVKNMGADPYRIGSKKMEITGYGWISDEDLIIAFQDQVSKKIKGFNQGTFKSKLAHFSIKTKEFKELNSDRSDKFEAINFVNSLPEEPGKILVNHAYYGEGVSTRPRDYYKLDLKTGGKELVLKSGGFRWNYVFDHKGNPRFATDYDGKNYNYYYRQLGGSGWTKYFSQSEDSFETFRYAGLVENNPSEIYVIANNGHDRTGLWKFNLNTKSFNSLVYRNDTVDMSSTFRHSNNWANPGKVTGYSYYKDKFHATYFDKQEEALIRRLKQSIPDSFSTSISSRSRDGDTYVVYNVGPKDPGTYYLYSEGQLKKIGSKNSLLDSTGLSDVEYITYSSRDGISIPGFVTKPKGAGPHPLIVMPHGGPYIRETVIFNDWAQMLANRGYMVLQPQYRGSKGYGLDFYKSAFINGGEGGKKMQNDKDDGVKYLIDKGWADKDKVAMFGWSYGGYAAFVAASRSPNLYQCVIAGAGVTDITQQLSYYRSRINDAGAAGIEQIATWTDSVNPIDEVDKVNVPMLIIHGSVDQRVPPKHSRKYVKKLKDKKIPHKYIELKAADHFSNTLYYDHKMEAYPAMFDFLKNECGM